ncbi:MAG: hypothetical protein AB1758_27700 [Candidatus Eremiobacterota bacterium]
MEPSGKIEIRDLEGAEEPLSQVVGGKVAMQDFHFVMRTAVGDVTGDAAKHSFTDFHF